MKNNNIRRIILPTNSITNYPNNALHASDIQVINSTYTIKTINDIINKKVNKNENPTPEAGVYSVKYTTCNKPYIRETSKLLKKRIYEHKLS